MYALTAEQSADLQYRVEIIDPGWSRTVAASVDIHIATAAYEMAVGVYSKNRVVLRQRARVLRDSGSALSSSG